MRYKKEKEVFKKSPEKTSLSHQIKPSTETNIYVNGERDRL